MKIDRLIGITVHLLNHEIVSASALAERFEVSKRTIQRDIDALGRAGIPVVSVHGAEGGYGIMDGFRPIKQVAGVEDYSNIITALKALVSAYDNERISATLEKALSALQGENQRVFVDFAVAREGVRVEEHMRVIDRAIQARQLLRVRYVNAENVESERVVEPLALSYRWYAWYLFAYCTAKQDYRLFKLPRIADCAPVEGSFMRAHGDVESLMKQTESSDRRETMTVRLLCKRAVRQQALEYLSANIVEERANGDFVLLLCAPFERMWFSLLMGFGDQVEVLEPESLRSMLKEKAREICSLY